MDNLNQMNTDELVGCEIGNSSYVKVGSGKLVLFEMLDSSCKNELVGELFCSYRFV